MNTASHPSLRPPGVEGWIGDRVAKSSAGTYHILVEKIENHVGESCVTPVPVHKKELAEMPELRDGEVTGHHGLQRKQGEKTILSNGIC